VSVQAAHEPVSVVTPLEGPEFASFGVSARVVEALSKRGIDSAFEIQAMVMTDALAGKDVLARSKTGSGKTLAFAVPIVERLHPDGKSPTALILVPTRELASQVTEEFRAIADVQGLHLAVVYGGVGIGPQAKKARHADIVIATPGRLLDLVARKMLRLDRVRICVLDEADRMLDMGFLPDVTRILELLRPERQTMLFSATLDGEVGRLAKRFTTDPISHTVVDDRPVIDLAVHRFISVEHQDKQKALVRELAAERGLTLIFVRTQRGADRLAKSLRVQGFHVGALHGGMSQPQRERALGRFASGANDVLVATDVAARGLDLEDITHVINYDAPADEKDYVHRVGRTARAGRRGEGITFVTSEQELDMSRIAAKLDLRAEFTKAGMSMERPRRTGGGAQNAKRQGGRPAPKGGGQSRGRRRGPRRRPDR
jgi:ATP-dependent RNA helicase RhlE